MNTCTEGQPFAANYNPFYNGKGLRGHTGQDWSCGWGTAIYSRYDGEATTVWGPDDTPAKDGYTCVTLLVDDGAERFEWQVGHLRPCISQGQKIAKGQLIGHEENHGPVYSGNVFITVPMQKNGDQRGHHRHYQKRPLVMTDTENGFNGCVDPTQPVFTRLLTPGMTGYDVYVMQRILIRHKFFTQEPTGYFGPVTTLALMRFQNAVGLSPVGVAGPQTRVALSQDLQPLPDLSGE